jgi:hypothetical protein
MIVRNLVLEQMIFVYRPCGTLMTLSKNNCQTRSCEHVFVMTFAKRLEFAQIYHIVYGHSLLLYNTLSRKFV